MARWFRFYEKKRGHRTTGSQAVGSLGEGLFFATCFLLGCIGLAVILATVVVPDWRVNHEFVETECTVLESGVGKTETADAVLYRPEVRIRFEVAGETIVTSTYDIRNAYSAGRDDKQAAADRFVKGRKYRCWYDPADPGVVVLVRGYNWWFWLLFVLPVAFILTGGGGLFYTLLHWGKSAERSAALANRTATLPLFDASGKAQNAHPAIPEAVHVSDSPGTTLAFRLPVTANRAWSLLASLALCVFWNGIVSIFLILAVRLHLEGSPGRWELTAFVAPFVLIGIGTIYFFFRQLVVATVIGPTIVEISDHPLKPGRTYDLFLSQAGSLKMNALEVLLVCDEEATYRQGTNARNERQRVFQQRVFRREDFAISAHAPLDVRCPVQVPAGAMHSFKSPHNEINWKILVKGEAAGWPDYERSFPLIIHPSSSNGAGER